MTDFAKAQLLKYGWTEGKGLGKNENGIIEALKPKLKFDTTGVGHDAAEYQWWEFVYNKAANNLDIDTSQQDVQMKVKDKDAVEIATSKSELNLRRIKKDHSLHFGSFIKTSTLQDGKDTINEDSPKSVFDKAGDTSFPLGLNDEELFKACRGRTAHKGARHGLTLNGKLARIERQEQELLMRLKNPPVEPSTSTDWIQVESKKHKKNKKRKSEQMDLGESDINPTNNEPQQNMEVKVISEDVSDSPKVKSKKSKLKEKRRIENLTHKLETSLDLSAEAPTTVVEKSKKKHKKSKVSSDVNQVLSDSEKVKKRKRKNKNEQGSNKVEMVDLEISEDCIKDSGIKEKIFVGNVEEPVAKRSRTDIYSSEADKLNSKIKKKKLKKLEKKTNEKLERISESLMVLGLEKECPDEESSMVTEKEKKKKKKVKT